MALAGKRHLRCLAVRSLTRRACLGCGAGDPGHRNGDPEQVGRAFKEQHRDRARREATGPIRHVRGLSDDRLQQRLEGRVVRER